jgi:dipeptidyl aminopeptidase/acylaminoacyl peptidase
MKRLVVLVTVLAALAAQPMPAQQVASLESGYQLPPKAIVDILDAAPPPAVLVSPTGQVMALLERTSMPSIAELAEPMLRLAGHRVNPRTNGWHGGQTTYGITLKPVAGGPETKVVLAPTSKITAATFSNDGKYLSFLMTRPTGVELWIVTTATGRARALTGATVNGLGGCSWLDDSSGLLCQFVPVGRGAPPAMPAVPKGPRIQENLGKAAPAPTFQDLLTSAHDEALYQYYFTSQLALVTLAGLRTPIGKPGLYDTASMSPDGQFILVARTKRPFSRLVPDSEFPKDIEVWSRTGELVRAIGEVPLGEGVPIGGVNTGPRDYRWDPAQPATLTWVEALDGGDPKSHVPNRDRVRALRAPFTGEPSEVVKTEWRFGGLAWTEKGVMLLIETDRPTRKLREWILDGPGAAPRKWQERNAADRYGDRGTPVFRRHRIVQVGDRIFLTGPGASPQGDRPFLDRLDLKTLNTERLFLCDERSYETVVAVLNDTGTRLLTHWETKTDVPNYFVRDLVANTKTALTGFKDPAPQLAGVQKQLITYARKDGVKLSATLYLPADYKPGTRLPFVLWAYPAEFIDAATASQVSGSSNRFPTVSFSSLQLLFLTLGYGVLDNPTMPIIGPGETANDTYVEQLVASAEAAVDTIVGMGVADRDRIGVVGHSYGAFMTANLLAHTTLFRAGVARSGAYNRTLTPFGFQNEERTFWEVPEVYAKMSPFWFADKVSAPLLLIHGEADNNSGTFPIQSERFYAALKGNGKVVRYVTLPLEAHGYAARESTLHLMYEWITWFDKYVKNAPPRATVQ